MNNTELQQQFINLCCLSAIQTANCNMLSLLKHNEIHGHIQNWGTSKMFRDALLPPAFFSLWQAQLKMKYGLKCYQYFLWQYFCHRSGEEGHAWDTRGVGGEGGGGLPLPQSSLDSNNFPVGSWMKEWGESSIVAEWNVRMSWWRVWVWSTPLSEFSNPQKDTWPDLLWLHCTQCPPASFSTP